MDALGNQRTHQRYDPFGLDLRPVSTPTKSSCSMCGPVWPKASDLFPRTWCNSSFVANPNIGFDIPYNIRPISTFYKDGIDTVQKNILYRCGIFEYISANSLFETLLPSIARGLDDNLLKTGNRDGKSGPESSATAILSASTDTSKKADSSNSTSDTVEREC